jgi:two-component system, OmpR family, response regulator
MAVAAASILVVDDEELVRDFLKRVLVQEGYDVLLVNHGGEALTLLQSLTVDLVITDIRMPGMGGKQLGAEIERLPNAPPVMYVSGGDAPQRGIENRYIQKPFKPAELIRAVRAILAR